MFSHKSPEIAQHLTFQLDNGRTISLTPDHYILINASAMDHVNIGAAKIVAAADVKVGDKLIIGVDAKLEWGNVHFISYKFEEGLYNPHTPSGTILVNHVAALTFPNTLPPSIAAHTIATFPAKLLYKSIPYKGMAMLINDGLLSVYFHTMSLAGKFSSICSPDHLFCEMRRRLATSTGFAEHCPKTKLYRK